VSPENTEHRKLAAIMFTDMVGYSALAQRNEALALELLEEHRMVVRAILPRHGGREVKTTGDGFLIEFPSALAAVQCAVALQRALGERNQSQAVERQIRIRIGIHVGDVVTQAGDIHGDGVNVAARIEPLATPGGICVTRAVFEQIENKVPQKLVQLSRPELKNISAHVEVYRLVLDGVGAQPSAQARKILAATVLLVILVSAFLLLKFGQQNRSAQVNRTGPTNSLPVAAGTSGDKKSVAVLPFLNLSADKADEYLSDGMTEELLNALAKVKACASRDAVLPLPLRERMKRTFSARWVSNCTWASCSRAASARRATSCGSPPNSSTWRMVFISGRRNTTVT